MTLIVSDFVRPPRVDLVDPKEAGFPTEAKMPRLLPWCLRFTRRFDFSTATMLLVRGECLRPWLLEGDVVWFDATLEPRIGDLVACRLKYRCKEGPMRGKAVELTAIKQLVKVGERLGLAAVEDVIDARDAEILGPITATHRRGWWRRPAMRRLAFTQSG